MAFEFFQTRNNFSNHIAFNQIKQKFRTIMMDTTLAHRKFANEHGLKSVIEVYFDWNLLIWRQYVTLTNTNTSKSVTRRGTFIRTFLYRCCKKYITKLLKFSDVSSIKVCFSHSAAKLSKATMKKSDEKKSELHKKMSQKKKENSWKVENYKSIEYEEHKHNYGYLY